MDDEGSRTSVDPSRLVVDLRHVPWTSDAVDVLPVGVGIWGSDRTLLHANGVLCDLLGTSLGRLVGTDLLDHVVTADRPAAAAAVRELLAGTRNAAKCRLDGVPPAGEGGASTRHDPSDGSATGTAGTAEGDAGGPGTGPAWPLRTHLTTFYGSDGRPAGLLGMIFDFAAANGAPSLPEGLTRVLEEGSDFLLVVEPGGRVSYGNRAAREALGVDPGSAAPTTLGDVLEPESLDFLQHVVVPLLAEEGAWQGELIFRGPEHRALPVSARFVSHGPVPDGDPAELGAVSVFARDITELKNAERKLRELATHDYLTGLPNRLLLYDRLELALNRYARYGTPVALMFCDLDGFKPVNDRYGHQVGDEVLQIVADRVHSVVRDTDTAARVGGDEFAVLVEGVDDLGQLTAVADRLISRVGEPVRAAGGSITVQIGVSIGLVVASEAVHEVDKIVATADSAMYRAKAGGRGRYVVVAGDDA